MMGNPFLSTPEWSRSKANVAETTTAPATWHVIRTRSVTVALPR